MPQRAGKCYHEDLQLALGYLVGSISHSHPSLEFFTDGVAVDYVHDPELVRGTEDWKRFHKAVCIKIEDETLDNKRSGIGDSDGYIQLVELLCLFEQTDEDKSAGLTLDGMKGRFVDDVCTVIRDDLNFKKAAAACGLVQAAADGLVIMPQMDGVTVDKGSSHPFIAFIVHISFCFDRFYNPPTSTPFPAAPAEEPLLP